MIPKETLRKIRRIQITTSRKVTDVFAGRYESVFKGAGMEFDEVRQYQPGDEIRSIDWNVTARTGQPYVKKFVEERQLTIMLLLDVSMSNRFATRGSLKSELAAEVCSVVALSAIRNNDRVGMMTFTDRVESYIPPRRGLKHVLRVIREALHNDPEGAATDVNVALDHMNSTLKKSVICFLISDFFAPDFRRELKVSNKRHDVIAVSVTDPAERELPHAGLVRMSDAETREMFLLDTSDPVMRAEYEKRALELEKRRREAFFYAKVDNIALRTDRSYVEPLIRFFRMREKRLMRI